MEKSKKSSKKDKRDREEEEEDVKKKKSKHHESKKKSKSSDTESRDKKRKNADSEDEDNLKKPKKSDGASKPAPAPAPAPQAAKPAPQAVKPEPKPVSPALNPSKFVIPPNQNTQAVPKRLHPNHWTKMLAPEILDKLELVQVVQNTGHMEGGWNLKYKDENNKLVNWSCFTPILQVLSASIHGVGLQQQEKKGDADRIYKIKLGCTLLSERELDEDTKKLMEEDPNLVTDQRKYAEGIEAWNARVGFLLFKVAKSTEIEAIYEKYLTRDIEKNLQTYYDKYVEKTKKPLKSLDEHSDREKKNLVSTLVKENLEEFKKNPENEKEVYSDFMAGMTTYSFQGDAKLPKDEFPTFRQQTKVFYKKKKTQGGSKDDVEEGIGSRKMPDKFSGGKNKGKSSSEKLKDLKDEEEDQDSGIENEYGPIDDYEERKFDDLPDAVVESIRQKMAAKGYIHRRFKYVNHDGSRKSLGKYDADSNYRVVQRGDWVQTKWTTWVYSLSGVGGRYGYKQQVDPKLYYIRQGVAIDDIQISEGSKIGRIEELRPKQLHFATSSSEPAQQEQTEQVAHESEDDAASDSGQEWDHYLSLQKTL